MLKEDGGPNFNPGGKFFTEDGDSDEYGTLALGFPIAAATIQNTKFMYTFVQQHSKLKLVGTYIIQAHGMSPSKGLMISGCAWLFIKLESVV